MRESDIRLILPVVVFISLLVVVGAAIQRASRDFKPPPPSTSANIIPARPETTMPTSVSVPEAPCLPPSVGFVSLRECNRQSDCVACSESPTSCVLVGSESGVRGDSSLVHPVQVNVVVPPEEQAVDCSGHGMRDDHTGVCVCEGGWHDDGSCADGVCYSGANCESAAFTIKKAGSYCLPSYVGACDTFTSDTVLTNVGKGTTWSCQCKASMAGLFMQEVEGGNCNKQIACGASVGVEAQVNVGSLASPVFEPGVVYPNRLTSYLDETQGQEACVYKTSEPIVTAAEDAPPGPNPPGATRVVIKGGSPDADPTCTPRLYSNTCTINTGGGNLQVIRGSGAPGDPSIARVSPPFYTPVPPGLTRCPDGWHGSGRPSDPCVNPADESENYAFFTEDGAEWLGPSITSVQELQSWWVESGPGDRWTTLEKGDVFCLETGASEATWATATNPESAFCADEACSAAEGFRSSAWSGARDGPLLDEGALPHWVSGGPYGGQCACDGSYTGGHAQVAQYQLTEGETPETWWSCGADMCPGDQFPDAYWDKKTQRCECNVGDEAEVGRPFSTGMNYKHPTTPAVCVKDPCNPDGVNVNVNEVSCTSDENCGGVCHENSCYIPFADGQTCSSHNECTGALSGMSNRVAKCMDGVCATLDLARDRMGSGCSEDAHCGLGACTGPHGEKTCGGGCACAAGFHQVSDGGISPLGFTCEDECTNKCLNGGECIHLSEEEGGGTECRCLPYFGGDRCETRLCARFMEYCDTETPCCSECPCSLSSTHCCNRFPSENLPPGGDVLMQCTNNVCQRVGPRTELSGSIFGNKRCEDLSDLSLPSEAYVGTCSNDPDHHDYHTTNPPDCNGMGVRNESGTCICQPSHTGPECETQLCSLEQQPCGGEGGVGGCCNDCICEDGVSRARCCGPGYQATLPFTSCEANFCQRLE